MSVRIIFRPPMHFLTGQLPMLLGLLISLILSRNFLSHMDLSHSLVSHIWVKFLIRDSEFNFRKF